MVYCDPILQQHLGTEASKLCGTSFFSYVHPEEVEQCRSDLMNIIGSKTLFGSVTRCRYCRVPEIRRRLGCERPEVAPDADRFVFDDNYLAIEVVINWIGEGMALAFYHAIIGAWGLYS